MSRDEKPKIATLVDDASYDRDLPEQVHVDRLSELFATLGMLGHKINNPLTALMGRAQILRMNQELDPQMDKMLSVIEDSTKRIAEYTRELSVVVERARGEILEELRSALPDS
jgi:signal transduction histidine kinase